MAVFWVMQRHPCLHRCPCLYFPCLHCFRANGRSHLLGNWALPQSLLQLYLIKRCSFGRRDRHQFRNAAFLGLTSSKESRKKKKNCSGSCLPSVPPALEEAVGLFASVLRQQQLSSEAAVQIHDGSVQTAVVIVHNSQQRVKRALLFLCRHSHPSC